MRSNKTCPGITTSARKKFFGLSARAHFLIRRVAKRLIAKGRTTRQAGLCNRNAAGRYRVEHHANAGESPTATNKRFIVCLTHESPWPIQAGNQYRISRMIGWFLAKGYQVLVLVVPMADIPISDNNRQAVFQKYDNVLICYSHGLIQNSIKTLGLSFDCLDDKPIEQAIKQRKGIDNVDNYPLHEYEIQNCHNALIGLAGEIARQLPDAVWYINYAFMSRVIEYLPESVVTFIDTHDVFSQKPTKVFSYGIKGESPITADEERRMLLRPNAVLAIQSDDAAVLRLLVPEQTVLTVGIDFDFVGLRLPPHAPNILMVASDNPLNTKGLRDFLQFAWPSIKAAIRDVKLTLVGLIGRTAQACDPQIEVAGTVESLNYYYERARVVINPSIAGTGLKVKAVECISHMRPIVTWPAGVDGIHGPLVKLCYVVENWPGFANTVIRLLTLGLDNELSGENVAAIQAELSTQAIYRELEAWLEQS